MGTSADAKCCLDDAVVLADREADMPGIVTRTWYDGDFATDDGLVGRLGNTLPAGHVRVVFPQDDGQSRVVHQDRLAVLDRHWTPGDLCKRSARDRITGEIISVSMALDIAHSRFDKELLNIPSSAVRPFLGLQVGDHVLFNEWVGWVQDTKVDCIVKMRNDALIRISRTSLQPAQPQYASSDYEQMILPGMRVKIGGDDGRAAELLTGVFPTDASDEEEIGEVCQVILIGVDVHWSLQNPLTQDIIPLPIPATSFQGDVALNLLTLYEGMLTTAVSIAERVVLHDLSHLTKEEVDSFSFANETTGIDHNTWVVKRTYTRVMVRWLDGSQGSYQSVDLVPFVGVHDYILPRTFVNISSPDGTTLPYVGIVQAVDVEAGTAQLLKLTEDLELIDQSPLTLPLTRIIAALERQLRVGDFVTRNPETLALRQSSQRLLNSLSRKLLASTDARYNQLGHAMINQLGNILSDNRAENDNEADIDWFGHVIDIMHDGKIKVNFMKQIPSETVCLNMKDISLFSCASSNWSSTETSDSEEQYVDECTDIENADISVEWTDTSESLSSP